MDTAPDNRRAQRCGNCAYAEKIINPNNLHGLYECHAGPPQLIVMPVQTHQGVTMAPAVAFPNVQADTQWCGMWKSI